jgi:hypothetical protein
MRLLIPSFVQCTHLARPTVRSYIKMSHNTQLPPFQKYVRALPTGKRNSVLIIIIVRIILITARLTVNSFLRLQRFKSCLWTRSSVEQHFNFIYSGSAIAATTTKYAVAHVPLSPKTRKRVTMKTDMRFPQDCGLPMIRNQQFKRQYTAIYNLALDIVSEISSNSMSRNYDS